ncbi:phosphoribosyltransferase [Salinactinospora qingdaonensis]|uniref:Amidophosphoribosyltransferase n=1 Tax=Salinactinospora qingdaonensis TaxID=702744 RepID=A0ABP7EWV6_9ACTN
MPGESSWEIIRHQVAVQVNYLHAALPAAAGACEVCYGAVPVELSRCWRCVEARNSSGGVLADAVVPISYRVNDNGQHAQDLVMYKRPLRGNEAARRRLHALFWYFCKTHITCVKQSVGIERFTHVCFVPSTKHTEAVHPLQVLLAPKISLNRVELVVNTGIDTASRSFHADWFDLSGESTSVEGANVLLIDDTWVTGARAQSAAHRLKRAGAHTVATVVLARELQPKYEHAKPLLDRVTHTRFDLETCVLHQS